MDGHGVRLLKKEVEPNLALDARLADAAEGTTLRGRRLLCAACFVPITNDGERMAIEGRQSHRRTNPAGITFDFGCFAAAPGAFVTGTPTTEHTWFSGYAWSFALCGSCGEHLGWFFEGDGPAGAGPSFFGLIHERLVPEPDDPRR